MTVLIPEVAEAGAAAGERAGAGAARSKAGQRARDTAAQIPGQYAGYSKELGRGRLTPGGRNYQGIILAEFLAAVLIVAVMPLFSGAPDGKAGPSPYRVNDITQLAAIGAVYFVLALLSSGERSGRVVAWFGGAVLMGILYKKTASGQLTAAISPTPTTDQETPPAEA